MRIDRAGYFALMAVASVIAAAKVGHGTVIAAIRHAKTYPHHETHVQERVTVAVDAYDAPKRDAAFQVSYRKMGILPVRVIVSNDGKQPLSFRDLAIYYVPPSGPKLDPATVDDLYRHVPPPTRRKMMSELDPLVFVPGSVAPHATYGNFLFFDMGGVAKRVPGSHLKISGIKAGGKDLAPFDVAL